ncbi:serine protease grass-like [Cylas formicarius]|uniref:serine protease grass-like n=1 Tax=Cylas formicarius TaxID=197179 RepID=UPI002958C5B1|nr:serine protease grass-like [Cylas formicarius]
MLDQLLYNDIKRRANIRVEPSSFVDSPVDEPFLIFPSRNANIKPICLPVSEINDDLTGKSAIVSGRGATEKGYKSPILLKVSVPVLPLSVCLKVYQQFAPITDQQICAGGYNGRDSCGGDSGGPMKYVGLVDGSPRYIQYGIVSFGPRQCGADGQPGIYTRIGSYIQWILDNMEE